MTEIFNENLTNPEYKFDNTTYSMLSDEQLNLDENLARLVREAPLPYGGEKSLERPKNSLPDDILLSTTPVRSQGKLGACVGFCIVSAMETRIKRNNLLYSDLSELWSYHTAKLKDPFKGEGYSGSTTIGGILAANAYGVCEERFKPYKHEEFSRATQGQAKNAFQCKIGKYEVLDLNALQLATALSMGYPVACTIKMFSGFQNKHLERGTVKYYGRRLRGAHALTCIGYRNTLDRTGTEFIFKNSWGTNYGDSGYVYIPQDILFNVLKVAVAIISIDFSGKPEEVAYPLKGTPYNPVKKLTVWSRIKRFFRRMF